MFGKLENKVAIITGAGQGIGAGIARVFAQAGAKVMVATRTASHGEATVGQIEKAGGTAALCAVDIGQLDNVERAIAETADKWGGIDIMVHNAASFLGGPVEGYSEDDLRRWRLDPARKPGIPRRTRRHQGAGRFGVAR